MFLFGSGAMYGTPLTDAYGNTISNPTPIKLGALQNISLDIQADIKELYGQSQFALDVAAGKKKIDGKASFAGWNTATLNNLFFGQTATSGLVGINTDLIGSTIPGTPYTITPTVPNSGTWYADLGVTDFNGTPYTRVASSPATGQYSVSAGVYTFAAADTGKSVLINFEYTATVSGAQKMTVQNLLMGTTPKFVMDLDQKKDGLISSIRLLSCVCKKISFATKTDDYVMIDFEFSAFANSSGQVLTMSLSQ